MGRMTMHPQQNEVPPCSQVHPPLSTPLLTHPSPLPCPKHAFPNTSLTYRYPVL